MLRSPAQIAASRANGQHSTGPKTAEGKAISRQNALKHGLTGQGIVIPGEDAEAVQRRVAAVTAELAVEGSAVSVTLAERFAALAVRAERSVRQEVAATAERVRNAANDFDAARIDAASGLFAGLADDPVANYRRLLAMPEGVDLLLNTICELRLVALERPAGAWTAEHTRQLDLCTGGRPGSLFVSPCATLGRLVDASPPAGIDPGALAGLEPAAQIEWALDQLVNLAEEAIDHLEAHRATLDLDRIMLDRAEAGQRALIDTGPEATLARKYEAATERAMFRTLRELQQIRLEHAAGRAEAGGTADAPPCRATRAPAGWTYNPVSGSFFPPTPPTHEPIHESAIGSISPPSAPVAMGGIPPRPAF